MRSNGRAHEHVKSGRAQQPSRHSPRSCSLIGTGHRLGPVPIHHLKGATFMFRTIKTLTLAGALAASCMAATSAQAGWIIGLVDGKSIVTIDPASRKVTSKADIKGATALLGIDVRPADGMLYGVAADGAIVTIDAK